MAQLVTSLVLVIVTLASSFYAAVSLPCPSDTRCTCSGQPPTVWVTCTELDTLPVVLPHASAITLTLLSSRFTSISHANMTPFANAIQSLTIFDGHVNLHIDADAFSAMTALRSLNISHTHGLELGDHGKGLTGPATLSSLRLVSNGFEHVPDLSALTGLQSLDLSGNEKIHADMPEALPASLRSLDLSRCKLQHLPSDELLKHLSSLTSLNVSGSALGTVEHSHLGESAPHLETLDLSHSEIGEIDGHAFEGLHHLKRLLLNGNELEELDEHLLASAATSLVQLNLSDNKLKTLSDHLIENCTHLRHLSLGGNSWDCSCKMTWTDHVDQAIIDDVISFTCDTPEEAHGKPVLETTHQGVEVCQHDDHHGDGHHGDDHGDHHGGHSKIIIAVVVFVLIVLALLLCFAIYHVVQKRREEAHHGGGGQGHGHGAKKDNIKYSEVYKDTTEHA